MNGWVGCTPLPSGAARRNLPNHFALYAGAARFVWQLQQHGAVKVPRYPTPGTWVQRPTPISGGLNYGRGCRCQRGRIVHRVCLSAFVVRLFCGLCSRVQYGRNGVWRKYFHNMYAYFYRYRGGIL